MDIFVDEDDDLLEKYNTISDKVNADVKNEFDSNRQRIFENQNKI